MYECTHIRVIHGLVTVVCSNQPPSEVQWLTSELTRGSSVGADPRLLSAKDWLYIDNQLRGMWTLTCQPSESVATLWSHSGITQS